MQRTVSVAVSDRAGWSEQVGLIIDIEGDAIASWCLDLVLLQQQLISELLVANQEGRPRLLLALDPKLHPADHGSVSWSNGFPRLALASNELEVWIDFYLKAYRDGVAEIDHIDTDIAGNKQRKEKGIFIALKAPAEPHQHTPEEVRRLLDL